MHGDRIGSTEKKEGNIQNSVVGAAVGAVNSLTTEVGTEGRDTAAVGTVDASSTDQNGGQGH